MAAQGSFISPARERLRSSGFDSPSFRFPIFVVFTIDALSVDCIIDTCFWFFCKKGREVVILNEGKITEVRLRVVLESDAYGREYFDDYDNIGEIMDAVERLVKSAGDEAANDRIERTVSIAIIPKARYGDQTGHGFGLEP